MRRNNRVLQAFVSFENIVGIEPTPGPSGAAENVAVRITGCVNGERMADVVETHTLKVQTSSGNMWSNAINPSSRVSHKTSNTGSSRFLQQHAKARAARIHPDSTSSDATSLIISSTQRQGCIGVNVYGFLGCLKVTRSPSSTWLRGFSRDLDPRSHADRSECFFFLFRFPSPWVLLYVPPLLSVFGSSYRVSVIFH